HPQSPLKNSEGGDDDELVLPAPIKITFDNTDATKANLIAPMPPKGYVHVPLLSAQMREYLKNPIFSSNPHYSQISNAGSNNNYNNNGNYNDDEEFSKIITSASLFNDQKNAVFDVPVSTSLYNNGYFPNRLVPTYQNKSIFDHIFEDSRIAEDDDEKLD